MSDPSFAQAPHAERLALAIVEYYGEDMRLGDVEAGLRPEVGRAVDLIEMELAGTISDLRWHPYFEVQIRGKDYCRYTADSSYWRNGKFVVEEVRSTGNGQEDPAHLLRRSAAELYCRMKVVLVGMSADDLAAV